ncbi:hypothetical protein BJ138DRAFT_1116495 [Hygrophoropsis aurantiaca]|uniref:Uncharacterized protein n=1 Tax=Hygrophoropsis aurantiaca TaxID=72124 RepID=A0ACB8A3A5_9AGAM|nr:hypothetical protein BJ138DRAFT_1116495 [Hygrophoropsis aurantiaca]
MGRPRLHCSPEEKINAARAARLRYYYKNTDIISSKMKAKYRCHIKAASTTKDSPSTTIPSPSRHLDPPTHIRHKARPSKALILLPRYSTGTSLICSDPPVDTMGEAIEKAKTMLTQLVQGSSQDFMDKICENIFNFIETDIPDDRLADLRQALDTAETITGIIKSAQADISFRSNGTSLVDVSKGQPTLMQLRSITEAMEDIYLSAVSDTKELRAKYNKGMLLHQLSEDIIC